MCKTTGEEYLLINPSDPYTFIAEDFETAALVVFHMGYIYGAETKSGDKNVPMFFFGGAEKWYKEQFSRSPVEAMREKQTAVASAMSSMMLGGFTERSRYNAALEAITDPNKREEFISKWQNECSSSNDIGTRAHRIGKLLAMQKGGHNGIPT